MSRLNFGPSTQSAYSVMFRILWHFVYTCVFALSQVNVGILFVFLVCLNVNVVSLSMQSNYLAALKAKFIIYGLPSLAFDDKENHYFVKSLRINRPRSISKCNIICIQDQYTLVELYDPINLGKFFRSVFPLALF